jgi:hypothetical protein
MWESPHPRRVLFAALQGLAEVLAVMGDAHLSELLPELSASATSKNPFVREGHLTLFRSVPLHGHSTVCANSLALLSCPAHPLAEQDRLTSSWVFQVFLGCLSGTVCQGGHMCVRCCDKPAFVIHSRPRACSLVAWTGMLSRTPECVPHPPCQVPAADDGV